MIKRLSAFLFGSTGSKKNAKSRLSFVLVQDRTGLNQQDLTKFKKEMVAVIQKYFDIQERTIDIDYKREGDMTTLVINSPVVVRRESLKDSPDGMAEAAGL